MSGESVDGIRGLDRFWYGFLTDRPASANARLCVCVEFVGSSETEGDVD
jgi:hypothetical protein